MIIKSDWSNFFFIAITAKVLSTEFFKSAGSKSSTNSLRDCFSSNEIEELLIIISKAEEEWPYFSESCLIASFTEFRSEFVISDNVFLETGLPFKYKTASILVTRTSSFSLFFSGFILSIVIYKSILS